MNKDDMAKKILEDEDYIKCAKFSNSLSQFLNANSDGVEDKVISRLLLMPEEEIEKIYLEAVAFIGKKLKKDDI